MNATHALVLSSVQEKPNFSTGQNAALNTHEERSVVPSLLTVPELAKELRIGRNTAYAFVRAGEIRSIKIGRSIRIPRVALEEFLSKR